MSRQRSSVLSVLSYVLSHLYVFVLQSTLFNNNSSNHILCSCTSFMIQSTTTNHVSHLVNNNNNNKGNKIYRRITHALLLTSDTETNHDDIIRKNQIQNSFIHCPALGGELYRIKMEGEEDGFLAALSVPTYAARCITNKHHDDDDDNSKPNTTLIPYRIDLNHQVPGAFLIRNAIPIPDCESIIQVSEEYLGFQSFNAGKNNHGAIQILVTNEIANQISNIIQPFIDIQNVQNADESLLLHNDNNNNVTVKYHVMGINRRWRLYRYEPEVNESFAPHIDAGFGPSGLSEDGTTMIWDTNDYSKTSTSTNTNPEIISRLTVLMYLNDDFIGGETKFYTPLAKLDNEIATTSIFSYENEILSVKPEAGSILVFPQAVTEEAVEIARQIWPLHEGSALTSGSRPKYVIRSDVLFWKEIKVID